METQTQQTQETQTQTQQTQETQTQTQQTQETQTQQTQETQTQTQQTQETQTQQKPVNLLDDDPEGEDKQKGGEEEKPPTDEEQKAFRESIKAIDIGEGVKWDDSSLEAMTPALMRLTGNDPKKAEGIVKAYTAHQQAQVKAMQEQQDKFLNGLVGECKKRFGDDLGKMCALAKAGGKRIFGDEIWNVMRKEPSFANNPDIIEKLAAFGRSVKDDQGVTASKPKAAGGDRDWRESMYGKK